MNFKPLQKNNVRFEPSNQRVFVCTFQSTTLDHAPCVPIIAINLSRVKAKSGGLGCFRRLISARSDSLVSFESSVIQNEAKNHVLRYFNRKTVKALFYTRPFFAKYQQSGRFLQRVEERESSWLLWIRKASPCTLLTG